MLTQINKKINHFIINGKVQKLFKVIMNALICFK